ncbi:MULTISPECIES: GNAT family N-acetyltransferase [Inquilinus]|uniref:GNAT superfamily N-acetyltransferase n=1 Tax=Inquilinus ginsengisoli TaxID=363840 RepID=A0ABU1K021_9PROT|nr:GNAT family N-acetyltransferase [Inquilinus ginsengisoli]MDR6294208.1 GNAT superfamily N-acetyltransferase [Inquilinus ginsengisoli]
MCDLSVRPLVAADVPMLLDMLRELAAHTGQSAAITAQRADLDEALAEVPPRFRGLIAEDGSGVVGYLSYTIDYSIWAGGDFIRVDDVYVRERARSQGVGRQLMRALADKGVSQDMRVRWEMDPVNHGARRFYDAIGAVPRDKTIWNWSVAAMEAFLDRVDPVPVEGAVPSEAGRGLPGEDGFILVLRRDDGQR